MRPAAELLLLEAEALGAVLDGAAPAAFDLPTVCTGWSVRDVLAHCGAALTAAAAGTVHGFTPDDNQRDVVERRAWPLADVIAELRSGYRDGAAAVDAAGGRYDGIGLGEWMHGGDVREPLGEPDPYASAGVELATDLLIERSARMGAPTIEAIVGGRSLRFGDPAGGADATLFADPETFVRLCGGRRPDTARYRLAGASPADLILFA